jgi:phenylacetate-CoA ligase
MLSHLPARTRDGLLELQRQRLLDAVDRAWQEIPFYRRKMSEAGLDGTSITSVADLVRLPVTTKLELRASEKEHPPLGDYRGAPMNAAVRLSTSSGATGKPTLNVMTRKDALLEYLLMRRTFERSGLKPGDIQFNAHPAYLYGASEFLSAAHESYGLLSISLGPPGSDGEILKQLELIYDLQPRSALLFPPAVLRYADVARREMKLSFPVDFGLTQMQLNEFGLQFADAREWHEKVMGIKLFNGFGSSEIFAATGASCAHGVGNHLNEDYVVLEVLDPETLKPVPDGQPGLAAISSLEKDNLLLRYIVGDMGYMDSEPCACGDPTRVFYRLGRSSDAVSLRGRRVTTADLFRSLCGEEELGLGALAFQVVNPGPQAESLDIRVPAPDAPTPGLSDRIAAMASAFLDLPVNVQLTESSGFSYKPTRLINAAAQS